MKESRDLLAWIVDALCKSTGFSASIKHTGPQYNVLWEPLCDLLVGQILVLASPLAQ